MANEEAKSNAGIVGYTKPTVTDGGVLPGGTVAAEKDGAEQFIKIGARNSTRDAERLQAIHDYAVENGAKCGMEEEAEKVVKSIDENSDEWLVNYGSAVKSLNGLQEPDFAIVYGGEDLATDYFDKNTEYGFAGAKTKRVPILFHHAQPLETESGKYYREVKPIGEAELEVDDDGVLIKEAILYNRKKYERYLSELGWSTGATSHAVVRESKADGRNYIKQWIIGELSVTPTSAEPRIMNVSALKSSLTLDKNSMAGEQGGNKQGDKEKSDMEKEEVKSVLDGFKTELLTEIKSEVASEAKTAAKAAVDEVLDNLPEVKAKMNGSVQITKDPGDQPFKSIAEQMRAVKAYRFVGFENADPRLKKQILQETKAIQGMNELIPSQGQFLLDPTLSSEFLKPIHETGPFSSRARKMPVSGNSNYGWINGIDETARTAGSRWGGVRGYWLSEGDSLTSSKPKFRRINWELHKVGVLMYATDELLADAAQLNAVMQQSAVEELNFMVNDAIARGSGAGQPSGILNGGALISATRTNATNIDHDDINRMINRLLPNLYASAVWFAHPDTQPEIDALAFTVGTTSVPSPYVTYTPNGVTMLRGRPVVYNEFCPTLGTVGDLLLAGMDDYLMWEKGGVEAASSVHVEFLTDQQVFRFIYRVDGKPASYTTLTPFQGSTTRSPYVALAATT